MSVYAFKNHIHEPTRRCPYPSPGPTLTPTPALTNPNPNLDSTAPYRKYLGLNHQLHTYHRSSFSHIDITHPNLLKFNHMWKKDIMYELHDIWEDTERTYSDLLSCVHRLGVQHMPAMTSTDSLLGHEVVTPEISAQVEVQKRKRARKQMREIGHEMGDSEEFMYGVRMTVYEVEWRLFGHSRIWESLKERRWSLWERVKNNIIAYEAWENKTNENS
jgi:hypothetical protein